mmetsp:Transcript_1302/g.2656  ORF Transcript_1302/g.2656 Transcript_1302/m.2656 type:complete len:230 (-) Transcript_1302:84-773(-)
MKALLLAASSSTPMLARLTGTMPSPSTYTSTVRDCTVRFGRAATAISTSKAGVATGASTASATCISELPPAAPSSTVPCSVSTRAPEEGPSPSCPAASTVFASCSPVSLTADLMLSMRSIGTSSSKVSREDCWFSCHTWSSACSKVPPTSSAAAMPLFRSSSRSRSSSLMSFLPLWLAEKTLFHPKRTAWNTLEGSGSSPGKPSPASSASFPMSFESPPSSSSSSSSDV